MTLRIRVAERLPPRASSARSGSRPTPPLVLDVVEQLPSEVDRLAVGCFSHLDRRAYVLTYAAFSSRQTWLGLPVSRELYESVGAHEVAHALTACTAPAFPRSVQASEYIASVVMFGTMHAPSRAAVLAIYPDADFASEWGDHERGLRARPQPLRGRRISALHAGVGSRELPALGPGRHRAGPAAPLLNDRRRRPRRPSRTVRRGVPRRLDARKGALVTPCE